MATNTLNTRIQLKYDSYANWMTNDPVLKMGEIAIATIPANETNAHSPVVKDNLPNVIIKVGDGSSKYSALKFVSGLAADVYAWAKAPERPTYTADDITGLETFINNVIGKTEEIQDTDTQYTIVAGTGKYVFDLMSRDKGETAYDTKVATIDLTDINTRLTDLETKVGNQTVAEAIAANNEGLANEDAAVDKQFVTAAVQTNGVVTVSRRALTADDIPELAQSKITGLVDALKDLDDTKQDNLVFEGTYNADNNKVATQSTVNTAISGLATEGATATTGEVIASVTQANGVVTVTKKALAKEDIPTIEQSQVNGLGDALNSKQDNLTFTSEPNTTDNRVATEKFVTSAVADLNGAMHFEGVVTGDTFEDAITNAGKAFVSGDVVLYGVDEYVYDGADWHILGNESIYALKTDVNTAITELDADLQGQIDELGKNKQDKLAFDGTYDSSTNKVATQSAVNGAIAALVKADAAEAGKFVTAVSQENGIITVSREALEASDIPTIAQSQVDGLPAALTAKQDNVSFADGYNADTNKAATVATVTGAINSLVNGDKEVENQFVTAAVQSNGAVTVSRKQVTAAMVSGLHAIATSGNVNDLAQTAGDVLILNCGTSNTVM